MLARSKVRLPVTAVPEIPEKKRLAAEENFHPGVQHIHVTSLQNVGNFLI